jgi:hypothetical protein
MDLSPSSPPRERLRRLLTRFGFFYSSASLLGLCFLSLAGCEEKPLVAPDEAKIRGLVTRPRHCGDPRRFQSLFADGAAPDDSLRPRYGKYAYRATRIEVSGDTATATVAVRKFRTEEVVAELQWQAVRSGNEWKLQDAPLPSEGPQ